MSASESGSALLQLPRELRDEIYSHYFDETYLAFWTYDDDSPFDKFAAADLAILRVSKAVSSDAKHILFSRAASKATTFKYYINLNAPMDTTPPIKEATDRMMNVVFVLEVDVTSFVHHSWIGVRFHLESHIRSASEATIDRFTGTAITRDNFWMHVNVLSVDWPGYFLSHRFFQALEKVTGFRNLTVRLQLGTVGMGGYVRWEAQTAVDDLSVNLEPHLGPCLVKKSGVHYDLEFHPLKFHVENLRAKAAKPAKEADKLEE